MEVDGLKFHYHYKTAESNLEVGKGFIRSFINPFDSCTIFSNATAFFKVMTASVVLWFTNPNFIKRRWTVKKRVIGSGLVIIEIEIMSKVKEMVEKIIKQGIIARA